MTTKKVFSATDAHPVVLHAKRDADSEIAYPVLISNDGYLFAASTPTAIGDNSKNVTTAGSRVQLISSSTPCKYVIIVALATNTNSIYVGGSTVAAGRGRPLVALQSEKIDIDDVSKIYIDADTSGEGVTFAYVS